MAMTQIEIETMTAIRAAAKKYAYQEDWVQRRYEIAKSVLASIATPEYKMGIAKVAVKYADDLIRELKGMNPEE